MKSILYKIWSEFLTQFGKLKVLTFGFFPIIAYDPEPFYVSGYDIERLMDIVKPGDVILRGYNKYLDGKFIPDPKGYSHAGIYIGGNEMVHAVAPKVEKCHIMDFCQADRIMVLCPKEGQLSAIETAISRIGIPYDFNYKTDRGKLYCFELIANCYPEAQIQTTVIKKFLGFVKRNCYIAPNIYGNQWFKVVFEKNAKKGNAANGRI